MRWTSIVTSILLFLPAFAVPCTARAQSVRFAALMDTLSRETDEAALRSGMSSRAPDAKVHVRNGLIAFRVFELTGEDVDRQLARKEFEAARDADDRSAWAHYGVALALANEPDVRSIDMVQTGRGLAKELGLDSRSKARREAQRAIALDRTHARAAALLGKLALLSRDDGELEAAAEMLSRFTQQDPPDEAALVMYSRVLVARGEPGSAVDVAMLANRQEHVSPDARLALANAYFNDRGGEEDGAAAYFDVVDQLTPALADRLFRDMQWIVTPRERAAWDSASLDGRRAWLEEFWTTRAALAGETVAERVAEHYRRLNIVLSRYVRRSDGPLPGEVLIQQRNPTPFDERGIIYLRHGEPQEIIHTPVVPPDLSLKSSACQTAVSRRDTANFSTKIQGGLRDTESWVYEDLDGRHRMYNFVQCAGDYPDFVIPWELPCDASTYQLWVTPREVYEKEISRCENDTRERIRDLAREALVTDSDRPDFERRVPMILDLLAFRGAAGLTDLTAPLAIAADSLGPRTRRPGVFRLGLTVAVIDTARRSLSRRDTTIFASPSTLPRQGEWLDTFVRIVAAPSEEAELRITLRDATSQGGNFHGTTIRVPDYGGDSLMVSSIVLGLPEEGGTWKRGSVSLKLMPYGEYEAGNFHAFYEIYNLPDSASYDTELLVQPMSGGPADPARPPAGMQPITLRFTDEARPEADSVVRELRRVQSQLPPGRYRITVTVTDRANGRVASSWRPFVIPPPPR